MWTYKTDDQKVVRITDYPDRHDPEKGVFYFESIPGRPIPHPIGETAVCELEGVGTARLTRITVQEANVLRGIGSMQIDIRGNAPTKDLTMENRQRKALEKNPMHTTMNDYKFGVEGSVPERAKKKSLQRMKKRGVNVKR